MHLKKAIKIPYYDAFPQVLGCLGAFVSGVPGVVSSLTIEQGFAVSKDTPHTSSPIHGLLQAAQNLRVF